VVVRVFPVASDPLTKAAPERFLMSCYQQSLELVSNLPVPITHHVTEGASSRGVVLCDAHPVTLAILSLLDTENCCGRCAVHCIFSMCHSRFMLMYSLFVYMSACLSVCSHISKTACLNVAKFSADVNCGPGSVLL